MRSVKLGDIEVGRIGLGTNRLTKTPENIAFIKSAVAAGVQMIDTAHSYTGGQSEETIGEALSPIPDGCVVATKGGFSGAGRGRPEVLRAEIEESLRRLRTDSIALYYLHRVDQGIPGPRQDPPCRHLRGRDRTDRAGPQGRANCRGAEPVQPLGAEVRRGRRLLRKRRNRVRSFLSAARARWRRPWRDRQAALRDHGADRARVAPSALAGDASDPGHAVARAPSGERGGARNRAHRRGARGSPSRRLAILFPNRHLPMNSGGWEP